jgi:hypothetical protein
MTCVFSANETQIPNYLVPENVPDHPRDLSFLLIISSLTRQSFSQYKDFSHIQLHYYCCWTFEKIQATQLTITSQWKLLTNRNYYEPAS